MSELAQLLAPERAGTAGAALGQQASRLTSGALAIASVRTAESDVRLAVLIIPGLVRIDVWRSDENLALIPRNLSPFQAHHTYDPMTAAGYRNEDAERPLGPLDPIELWVAFDAPEEPIYFISLVSCVADSDVGSYHFLAKGEAWLAHMRHREVKLQ